MKICTKCLQEKPFSEFSPKKGRPGQKLGWRSRCKECTRQIHREKYNKRPRKRLYGKTKSTPIISTTKTCNRCKRRLFINEFYQECQNPTRNWHYSSRCKSCCSVQQKPYTKSKGYRRPSESLLEHRLIEAKRSAVRHYRPKHGYRELQFTIGVKDIRELLIAQTTNDIVKCAATGVELDIINKNIPLSPSIDRIDNRFGYTRKNIRIVALIYNLARNSWTDEVVNKSILQSYKPVVYDWSYMVNNWWNRKIHKGCLKNGIYTNQGSRTHKPYLFTIVKQDLFDLIVKQTVNDLLRCAATNVVLTSDSTHPLYPSIDRIDCQRGYEPNNIRITSRLFNLARNKWDDQITLEALFKIRGSLT